MRRLAQSKLYMYSLHRPSIVRSRLIFTARCYADRNIALGSRLSVRPPVTLVDCDHTHWDSQNIISRINSVILPSTWDSKILRKFEGWLCGTNHVILPITHFISQKRRRIRSPYCTLIGTRIRRFDWCKDLQAWLTFKKESRWFCYFPCKHRSEFRLAPITSAMLLGE